MFTAADIPFLIQLIRFLHINVHKKPEKWLSLIHEQRKFFIYQIEYLMANCLNVELLRLLLQYLNDVLYRDEELASQVLFTDDDDSNFIIALCQACQQILTEIDDQDNDEEAIDTNRDVQFFHNFWFILEMVTRGINIDGHHRLPDCGNISELFIRFATGQSFIDFESSNSINSFSAACACLIRFIQQSDDVNNPKNILTIFQQTMTIDRLKLTFNKSLALLSDQQLPIHQDDDDDGLILRNLHANIDHLYRYLFSS